MERYASWPKRQGWVCLMRKIHSQRKRFFMKFMRTLIVSVLVAFSPVALAETVAEMLKEMAAIENNATLLQNALNEGRERATLCVHCHGVDGNSKRDYIPNLASQNASYLFTQFEHFADGTRKDYVMSKLAGSLTANDRIAVALYFSRGVVQPREQGISPSPNGKSIYDSMCIACHGQKGHGTAQYPRIAGQPYEYLVNTLLKFSNNDPERMNSPMNAVVGSMSEQQLRDVASFVTNMP